MMILNDILCTMIKEKEKSNIERFIFEEKILYKPWFSNNSKQVLIDVSKYLSEEYQEDYYCFISLGLRKTTKETVHNIFVKKDSKIHKKLKELKYSFPYEYNDFCKANADVEYSVFLVSKKDVEVLKDIRENTTQMFVLEGMKKAFTNLDTLIDSIVKHNAMYDNVSKNDDVVLKPEMFYNKRVPYISLYFFSLLDTFCLSFFYCNNIKIKENIADVKEKLIEVLKSKYKNTESIKGQIEYISSFKITQALLLYICGGITDFDFSGVELEVYNCDDIMLTGRLGI